ncbi:MAG: tRNA pseudouridine(55) synthase TruB [Candidatus Eisenbacteria bacterium]|nr:tRNA pseudouridine(55) synthase TruB [Candidatus Eisenbacteria bacterium]
MIVLAVPRATRRQGEGRPMRAPHPLDGQGFVLNVFKESPWTSHDAVQRVRRILHYRRVGHTGTLDPFATGVLLCCVGRATKLSNYLMELPKRYEGALRFGVRTDTGDSSGTVTREWDLPVPPLERLAAVAGDFEGEILQTPPMVSALKHQGERLYRLARRGITVERQPRRVRVDEFAILGVTGERVHFRVRCARGTYVRTLVEDFGEALGAGACVENLCRTAVGHFAVRDAVRLEESLAAETLRDRAVSMADALAHLPAWVLPPFWVTKLRQGSPPPWVVIEMEAPPEEGSIGRLVGEQGDLLALGRAVAVPGPADRAWQDRLRLELLRVI